VDNVRNVNRETKVTVASRVPPDLAEAVAQLADAGDRTISREIGRALKEHVARSAQVSAAQGDGPSSPPANPAALDRDPEAAGSRARTLRAGSEGS
jgi:hypothetical protein